ncbi:DUF2634 domain-containing protein [Aneurinibacillus thermoaerophilus]|uniref:DUF2634 domain-containing protein n=1 Tax=Aneurinibacillus thermoaerophilus TaxID=143495 RepID=UPI002E22D726|nr:DUF2634 domain-containing protein [Aneurinibacillus thermoaerophilus]MED0766334.1 DUF2634 domain-containing protein [Aneurinibacillus thermoaerophilus]
MGLLPEVDIEAIIRGESEDEAEEGQPAEQGYLTPLFDFEKGEFVLDSQGRIVEDDGLRGMENLIEKAHQTARNTYEIYSDAYGTEEQDVLAESLPEDIRQMRVKEAIRDCLIYDDRIIEVGPVELKRLSDGYVAIYEIETIFGILPVRREV